MSAMGFVEFVFDTHGFGVLIVVVGAVIGAYIFADHNS